ncbi:MAG: hydantoinase B/oxoprolinase family protein [Pusillimonas sp.]
MSTENSPVDPILLEVVRNKLEGIANEMQLTLLKSAFSPIVKEGMDCSAALFSAKAETIGQATAIPIHLATMKPALEAVLKKFELRTMRPGDVFAMNDAYHGGTHLPDITVFLPVFGKSGDVLAFSVTTVHHQDVGGMEPGSIPTTATEIFQEGLRIPPLHLYRAGERNDTLFELLALNVRIPSTFFGDLDAQLAAGNVGMSRCLELFDKYGEKTVLALFEELISRSEHMTRESLRQLPEGTFHYEDFLDNDGVDLDKPVKIRVAVTISDGFFHCDFTGTDPQVRGPMNCVPSSTMAAVYYALRTLTDPSIPTNGGCFRPVSVVLPEGSLVNPNAPAAVNARTATIKRMCSMILSAVAQAAPERMPAQSAGISVMLAFSGKRQDGSPFIVSELVAAGTGAGPSSDGVDCLQTDGSNSMNLPIEALMKDTPIAVRRFRLRTDSGGKGMSRGGLGADRCYEILQDGVRLSYRGERHKTSARGLNGGEPGATSYAEIIRPDGSVHIINSKITMTLNKGDRLVVGTAGGGGYGDSNAREPQKIEQDYLNRKSSRPREPLSVR